MFKVPRTISLRPSSRLRVKSVLQFFGISNQKLSTSDTSRSSHDESCASHSMVNQSKPNLVMQPLEENDRVRISAKANFPTGVVRQERFDKSTCSMELTFLGTASCYPTPTRSVSCIALQTWGDVWLFDCGEGAQLNIQQTQQKISKIKKIFITHMHGDHLMGLAGIICKTGQSTLEQREVARMEGEIVTPVEIYGPEGLRDYLRAVLQLTYSRVAAPYIVHELKQIPPFDSRQLTFEQILPPSRPALITKPSKAFHEWEGGRDIYPDYNNNNNNSSSDSARFSSDSCTYTLFENDEFIVRAAPMVHNVPCVGYVVTEKHRPATMKNVNEKLLPLIKLNKDALMEKMPELEGDPMRILKILKLLKPNSTYTFPLGQTIHTDEFLEPYKRGRKIVIMGDTCSGKHIKDIAMNADILIHEATNAYSAARDNVDRTWKTYEDLEKNTISHGHSTPEMAGKFAAEINATKLILTHFSPRYDGGGTPYAMNIMWRIEDMARNTSKLYGLNDVIAAWDLMNLDIPYDDSKIVYDVSGNSKDKDENIGINTSRISLTSNKNKRGTKNSLRNSRTRGFNNNSNTNTNATSSQSNDFVSHFARILEQQQNNNNNDSNNNDSNKK